MNRNKEYEMLLKQVRQKVKDRIDKDYPNVNLSKSKTPFKKTIL